MSKVIDLAELMALVHDKYRFDSTAYPELPTMTTENVQFGVRHTALHMMKSTAIVAAEAEKADHGDAMLHAELELAVRKQLINALKLAALLGISAEELATDIQTMYQDR